MQEVRASCEDDAKKFCAGVQPGGGRIAQCLKQHEADLSDACRNEGRKISEERGAHRAIDRHARCARHEHPEVPLVEAVDEEVEDRHRGEPGRLEALARAFDHRRLIGEDSLHRRIGLQDRRQRQLPDDEDD
jgi:hypothetical protein